MKTTMSQGGVKAPDDGLAPCGCRVRFDNDGLIRLAACPMHAAAPDLLEACKMALTMMREQQMANAKRGEPVLVGIGMAMQQCDKAIAKATKEGAK